MIIIQDAILLLTVLSLTKGFYYVDFISTNSQNFLDSDLAIDSNVSTCALYDDAMPQDAGVSWLSAKLSEKAIVSIVNVSMETIELKGV